MFKIILLPLHDVQEKKNILMPMGQYKRGPEGVSSKYPHLFGYFVVLKELCHEIQPN